MDKESVEKRLTIFYAVLGVGFIVFIVGAALWANIVRPTGEAMAPVGRFLSILWKAVLRDIFGS